MTIFQHASTPAVVDNLGSTSATAVTASFSPPAGSLVLVAVNVGLTGTSATMTMSVADSLANSYTAGPFIWAFSANGVWYFTRYYAAAPGSITVTATRSVASAGLFSVKTVVLQGAAAIQAGAAAPAGTSGNSTTMTGSITPTVIGSWSFASTCSNSAAGTASGLTDDHNVHDGTDGALTTLGHVATAALTPATIGWTSASAFWAWAAMEILPAWTVLQSAGTGLDPGAAAVTFTTANVSAGTKLIAYIATGGGSNPQVTAVKDAALNSMTKVASAFLNNAAASGELSIWAMDTPAGDVGTKPTLTATQTGGNQSFGMVIQEVYGLAAGNTLAAMIDGTAVASTGSISANGPIAEGSYSSAAPNEYLIAVGGDSENATLTWAAPTGSTTYTRDANARNATIIFNCVPSYGNSTSGAETASSAITGAGTATPWATLFVAFKLTAAAGGGTAPAAAAQYAPGWHPGAGLPGLPGGTPFYSPPSADVAGTVIVDSTGSSPAGAGAVTAVVTQIAPATAAGAGSVTAAATVIAGASAAGAGAASAKATQIAPAAAASAGAVSDVATQQVIASAAGAGSVTDVVTQIAAASAAGAGAVTALATQIAPAVSAGSGAVSDVVTQIAPAAAAGAGSVTAAGSVSGTSSGTAAVAGAGSVSAVATQIAPATAAGSGAATAVATQVAKATAAGAGLAAPVPATQIAPAISVGAGAVSDVATQIAVASAAGAGSVTAAGSVTGAGATASAAGAGAASAVVTQIAPGSAAGAGSVSDVATQIAKAAAAGAGAVTAAGYIAGTANVAGAGTAAAKAAQAAPAAAAGAAVLSALATQRAIAALAAAGAATAAATVTAPITYGTARQGVLAIPGAVNGTSPAAAAQAGNGTAARASQGTAAPGQLTDEAGQPLTDETGSLLLDEAGTPYAQAAQGPAPRALQGTYP